MAYPTGLVEKLRNRAFEGSPDEITSNLSIRVIRGASAERLIRAILDTTSRHALMFRIGEG